MLNNVAKKTFSWVDERFSLSPLIQFMQHKKVPVHRHMIWYYMGGVTLFLFMVQVATGILLLFYYQPGISTSHESIRFIMGNVKFGWLFRSIHNWSANLMLFFAFLHMFSAFFLRAYKKPREMTWLTGCLLLLFGMALGFSGYLLPWDELAFFATKVGTDIAGAVPLIGEPLKELLRGGTGVTGATLTRFYAFHVALFPAIFSSVLILHLAFIQRQGMHAPSYFEKLPLSQRREIPFFPDFILRDTLLWLIILNVLLYLAVFWPVEVGLKADPFTPAPAGIRPEWYFMFMFQTLKYIPGNIWFMEGEVVGVISFGLLALAWLLVPFWELKARPNWRWRPMNVIGVVVVAYIVIMTILGYSV